jgi:hypothetical protein
LEDVAGVGADSVVAAKPGLAEVEGRGLEAVEEKAGGAVVNPVVAQVLEDGHESVLDGGAVLEWREWGAVGAGEAHAVVEVAEAVAVEGRGAAAQAVDLDIGAAGRAAGAVDAGVVGGEGVDDSLLQSIHRVWVVRLNGISGLAGESR